MTRYLRHAFTVLAISSAIATAGAQGSPTMKPQDTEIWKPIPPVVVPGKADGQPPSDAVVLFDGRNLDEWLSSDRKGPAQWRVADGVITVDKKAGDIQTRRSFGNFQLHIEWRVPANVTGSSQER